MQQDRRISKTRKDHNAEIDAKWRNWDQKLFFPKRPYNQTGKANMNKQCNECYEPDLAVRWDFATAAVALFTLTCRWSDSNASKEWSKSIP